MKNKLFILLLAFVLLLSACSNNSPPDDNTKEVLPELESAGSIESRGEKFIENFPQDYPSFELLEYVFGSAENAPIQLVAIARNKETGSSATLFVLDENGVGQVVLASGYSATYCKEDGLQLDKNELVPIVSPDGSTPASLLQDTWFSIGKVEAGKKLGYHMHQTHGGVYIFLIEGEIVVDGTVLKRRDGMGVYETNSFEIETLKDSHILLIEVPM